MADAPAVRGDLKVPGLGKVDKKAFIVAALVGAGVLGYAWLRHSKSAGSASSSAAAAGTDPNLDPATGYDYGTPQDLAALQAQQGVDPYGSGLGAGTGAPGTQGGLYWDPATGQYDLPGPYTGGQAQVTTNAQWEQQAIADLEAGGVSQATVSDAEAGLPRYLAKLGMSQAQATAVQMAVGLAGPPPTGGPYAIKVNPDGKPPPKGPTKTITADGKQDLHEIAVENGVTEAEIITWNKSLAHFAGTGKPIPKGTKVRV